MSSNSPPPKRIMFYVQHLLGIGHVKRAGAIAAGLHRQGFDVLMVLGGPPVALVGFGPIRVHQLPPVRADGAGFDKLLDGHNRLIDDNWREKRASELMRNYRDFTPDILLIEMFPFGRRQFRFELIPLLQTAREHCTIMCSLRDILVARTELRKNQWMVKTARDYFDHILVHGDAAVLPLQDSFPLTHEIQDLIHYTGYVVDGENNQLSATPAGGAVAETGEKTGSGEIIVSVGGGAVGEKLLRCAMSTASDPALQDYSWRLLAGENLDGSVLSDLKNKAPGHVIVERARPDFRNLLHHAALSISQGGYNTLMDILSANCKNVIVPFAAGAESEQTQRTKAFAQRGLLTMLEETELSPQTLASACRSALNGPPPQRARLDLTGVSTTARMIQELAQRQERPDA